MVERLASAFAVTIVENAPMGILVLDEKGQILSVNKALAGFLGIAAKRLMGQGGANSAELTPAQHACLFDPPETLLLPATDSCPARWLRCWRQPLGEVGWNVHFYSDITGQQQLRQDYDSLAEELALHALRDPLTSLPNRRALLQGLEPQVSRSRRYENPLAILLLKIDNLAQLDAEYGADSGKRVVVALSQLLKDQLRWVDMVGRMDTDEFLVILPETPESAATDLANKLRARIATLQVIGGDGRAIALKVRCNVVGWVKGEDSNKLLRRAYEGL